MDNNTLHPVTHAVKVWSPVSSYMDNNTLIYNDILLIQIYLYLYYFNMKRIFGLIVVVIIVGIGITSLQSNGAEANVLRIGAMLSLSGNTSSFYGEYNKNALELAKDEINKNGGVLEKQIEIVYENSQGDKQLAVSGIQKLIATDKTDFIISDITAVSLAIAPIAESNKKILIATSASTPDLTNAGDYLFRTKLASTIEGKEAARYISTNIKPTRVAYLYQNSDYGTGVFNKFSAELKEKGITPVTEQKYETGALDMRQQLLSIKEKKPDLIIVAGFPKEIGIIIRQAREMGISTPFFAHSGSIGPDIELVAGKNANDLMYLSELDTETNEFKNFSEAYFKAYGKYPELFASNGYDALMLIANAIKACDNENVECVKTKLYETKEYKGVSGSITYDSNGDLTNRSMVCRQKVYRDDKLIDISCR